jgi:dienelactone hydrolase
MRRDNAEAWAQVRAQHPIVLTPGFLTDLADHDAVRLAEIPIERAACPILMISGEDDAMWPSTVLAEIAEKRAAQHGFGHRLVHLRYPDAGHTCGSPPGLPAPLVSLHPVDNQLYAFGGSAAGNAAAQADSWQRSLAFLRNVL